MSATDIILKSIQCPEIYIMGALSGGLLGSTMLSKFIKTFNSKSKITWIVVDNLIIIIASTVSLLIIGNMLVDLLSNVVTTFRLM